MDGFTLKTHTTTRGYTYAYHLHNPATPTTKPALLLCHGYPDEALLWSSIVPALLPLGHPLLIPDMLGYGGTAKPTFPAAYTSKLIAQDLYELADAEQFGTIIPTGHDWGAYHAARLHLWQPQRCAGLILLSVAYQPPSADAPPFNLEASMARTEQLFGYTNLAYWELFAAADGAAVLRANVETFFHLMHWDDAEAMRKVFCTRGAMRRMLTEMGPEDFPLKEFARQPGFKEAFVRRMERDGFEGAQCYYKVVVEGLQGEAEKGILRQNLLVGLPCLYVSGTGDAVCRTDLMGPVKGLVPDLEERIVEAGHWIPYEKPKEVGGLMAEWLGRKFGGA